MSDIDPKAVRRIANSAIILGVVLLGMTLAGFRVRVVGGIVFLLLCCVSGAVLGFGTWARLNAESLGSGEE